jgi:hypothetical protein
MRHIRFPRFSLLTLLFLTAIAALSITVIVLWREVGPLRAENKRLHEERGTLMVDDPTRLHAIKIPSRFAGEGRESYRIFVPKDSLYWAFVAVNDIPKERLPRAQALSAAIQRAWQRHQPLAPRPPRSG